MEPSEPAPDCQSLTETLRTELQAFYRTLRFSRDPQKITQAAERLQVALSKVESVVANPKQRYSWPHEQQWNFVSLFAYVQEVKLALKAFTRRFR